MTTEQQIIIQVLKQELEHQDKETGDSQWLMAAAIAPFKPTDRTEHLEANEQPTHTARVIVKTNATSYVDGTDIYFTIDSENNIADCESWVSIWAAYEPLYHGGSEADSLTWLREWAEPFYLQLENPFTKPNSLTS